MSLAQVPVLPKTVLIPVPVLIAPPITPAVAGVHSTSPGFPGILHAGAMLVLPAVCYGGMQALLSPLLVWQVDLQSSKLAHKIWQKLATGEVAQRVPALLRRGRIFGDRGS